MSNLRDLYKMLNEWEEKSKQMLDLSAEINNKIKEVVSPEVVIINEIIIDEFGFSLSDLSTESHKKEFVTPRHISIFLLDKYSKLGYIKIMSIFNRDRSVFYSALKNVNNRSKIDKTFRLSIEKIEQKVKLNLLV